MSLLVGLQDISLDPVLIGILLSGLGVYQCPFVDVWGSSIAVASLPFVPSSPNPGIRSFVCSFQDRETHQAGEVRT